jgi:hypothetical protein
MQRPPLPPGLTWYSFSEAESTWNCQMPWKKTPATLGIDPGTFRFVAQYLNHYATPDPIIRSQITYWVVLLAMMATYSLITQLLHLLHMIIAISHLPVNYFECLHYIINDAMNL